MGLRVTKLREIPPSGRETFPRPRQRPRPNPAPVPKTTPGWARDPLAFPPDPQEGGGRELLPTENSHFFAARFRNTPGLMPFGELCNQGQRSRAKQTRLCVCSRGPGEAHRGREGLRPGLGVRLGGSENAAGGSRAGAPSRRGPRPSAGCRAGPLGPPGSAPPPPRPPPPPGGELGPKSRRTAVTARGQSDLGLEGGAGKCDSSSGSIPARDPSVPLPTALGRLRAVVWESDDPTSQLGRKTDAGDPRFERYSSVSPYGGRVCRTG